MDFIRKKIFTLVLIYDLFNEICGLCVSYAKLLDLDVEHKIPAITSSWANIADNRMKRNVLFMFMKVS